MITPCLLSFLLLQAAASPAASAPPDRAALAAAIEAHRKGDVVVEVTRERRPVAGARVEIRQTRHAFLFGSNIFGLRPDDPSPLQAAYRERFVALFDYATLPFYWGRYEPRRGQTEESRLRAMAGWCRTRGIDVKGHPVLWHEVFPRWIGKDDAIEPLVARRIRDTVETFRGLVDRWDVVNESLVAPDFDNAWGLFVKAVGPTEAVDRALRLAAAANPEASLLVNDFRIEPGFEAELRELRERGAPFHAIGIQSHMHGEEWSPERTWSVCETYGRLGLPLHFTELTVLSGPKETPMTDYHRRRESWKTTPEEEAHQAEYVERFYELLFAHPAVEAITWWDLSDFRSWMAAPAGLLREDMSPKPAYERLLAKIRGEWWTARAEAVTDESGRATLRAFKGSYEATVTFPDGVTRPAAFEIGGGSPAVVQVKR